MGRGESGTLEDSMAALGPSCGPQQMTWVVCQSMGLLGSLASLLGVQDNVLPGVWTIPGLLDKADVTASGWDASAFSLSISATT